MGTQKPKNKNRGIYLQLHHGDLLTECALKILHSTTKVATANKLKPKRIACVMQTHNYLNLRNHGYGQLELVRKISQLTEVSKDPVRKVKKGTKVSKVYKKN